MENVQVFPCRYAKAHVGPARGVNQSYPGAREQNIKTRGTGCSNITPNDIHGTVADRAVRRTERARPGSNIRIYPSWSSSEVQTSLPQLQIAGPSRDQTGPGWQTNYQGTRQYLQRPKEKTQTNIGYPNVKI